MCKRPKMPKDLRIKWWNCVIVQIFLKIKCLVMTFVCACVYLEPFPLPLERCAPVRREPEPLQLLAALHMHTLDSLTKHSFHISLITRPSPTPPPSHTVGRQFSLSLLFLVQLSRIARLCYSVHSTKESIGTRYSDQLWKSILWMNRENSTAQIAACLFCLLTFFSLPEGPKGETV